MRGADTSGSASAAIGAGTGIGGWSDTGAGVSSWEGGLLAAGGAEARFLKTPLAVSASMENT